MRKALLLLALIGGYLGPPLLAQNEVNIDPDGTTRHVSDLAADGALEAPEGTTLPGTCDVGDVTQDTDAPSGSKWCTCYQADTWDCTEEDDHASEHAENAADELFIENLGTACTLDQVAVSDGSGGLDCADQSGGGGGAASSNIKRIDAEPATANDDDCEFNESLCGYSWSAYGGGNNATESAINPFSQTTTSPIYDLDSAPGKLLFQMEDDAAATTGVTLLKDVTLPTNATIIVSLSCAGESNTSAFSSNNGNCGLILCNSTDGCAEDAVIWWRVERDGTTDADFELDIIDNGTESTTFNELDVGQNNPTDSNWYLVLWKQTNDYWAAVMDDRGKTLFVNREGQTKGGTTTMDQVGFIFLNGGSIGTLAPFSTVDFIRVYDGITVDFWNFAFQGAGGSPVALDLGNNATDDIEDLIRINTTGDTNSIFTENVMDEILIDLTKNWPQADTLPNDAVTEAMLKAVDTPADEDCLTYESTVGDFEWQECGEGGGGGGDANAPYGEYDPDNPPSTCSACEEWTGDTENLTWRWGNQQTCLIGANLDWGELTMSGAFSGQQECVRWTTMSDPESDWTATTKCAMAETGSLDHTCGLVLLVEGSEATPTELLMIDHTANLIHYHNRDSYTDSAGSPSGTLHSSSNFIVDGGHAVWYQMRYDASTNVLTMLASSDGMHWWWSDTTTLSDHPTSSIGFGIGCSSCTSEAYVDYFRIRTDSAGLAGEVGE